MSAPLMASSATPPPCSGFAQIVDGGPESLETSTQPNWPLRSVPLGASVHWLLGGGCGTSPSHGAVSTSGT